MPFGKKLILLRSFSHFDIKESPENNIKGVANGVNSLRSVLKNLPGNPKI